MSQIVFSRVKLAVCLLLAGGIPVSAAHAAVIGKRGDRDIPVAGQLRRGLHQATRDDPQFGSWYSWGYAGGNGLVAAADSSYVYELGGYEKGGPGSPPSQYDGFGRFDVASQHYEGLSRMPIGFCYGAAAVIGDTLYAHGGVVIPDGTTSNFLQKYCISTDHWSGIPGCCQFNYAPCMVALGGRLYYVGGAADWHGHAPSAQTWCYTPGAATPWKRKADMRLARTSGHAGVHGGRIYMAGGSALDTGEVRETEFYDPERDTWVQDSLQFPWLPEPRRQGAAGVVGNTMFIYSGSTGGSLSETVLEYDFLTGQWSTVPGVPGSGMAGNPGVGSVTGLGFALGETTANACTLALAHDVGPIRVVEPGTSVDSGDLVTPRVTVRNYGMSAEQLRVQLSIGSDYSDIEDLSLGAIDSADVTFSAWHALQVGGFVARCSTLSDGDLWRENDTFSISIHVGVPTVSLAYVSPRRNAEYPPDTMWPLVGLSNTGIIDVPVLTTLDIFLNDTEPKYHGADSTVVLAGERADRMFNRWYAGLGRYRIQVVAKHRGKIVDSTSYHFTIAPEGIEGVAAASRACRLCVTPTHCHANARAEWSLARAGSYSLKLFDVKGSLVRVLAEAFGPPGRHSVEVSAAALAPGVYLVRLDAGEASATRKLIRQ